MCTSAELLARLVAHVLEGHERWLVCTGCGDWNWSTAHYHTLRQHPENTWCFTCGGYTTVDRADALLRRLQRDDP